MIPYVYRGNWVRVIDGCTVILNIDLGLETFHMSPFKLRGIEVVSFSENFVAASMAKELLERILLNAGDLTIKTYKPLEKESRWSAEIFFEDDKGQQQSANVLMAQELSKLYERNT